MAGYADDGDEKREAVDQSEEGLDGDDGVDEAREKFAGEDGVLFYQFGEVIESACCEGRVSFRFDRRIR